MVDSVTQPTPWHNPPEMSAFGIIIAAGIALVLLPLWPFIAVLLLAGYLRETNALKSTVDSS
ncbi:MAG: hypothetical protein ABEJ76_08425 [Halanaeroarchaeum sp.]